MFARVGNIPIADKIRNLPLLRLSDGFLCALWYSCPLRARNALKTWFSWLFAIFAVSDRTEKRKIEPFTTPEEASAAYRRYPNNQKICSCVEKGLRWGLTLCLPHKKYAPLFLEARVVYVYSVLVPVVSCYMNTSC